MAEEHEDVEKLVTRARSGDLEAFEMLFRAHQAGIYSFVRSQIRNAEAAADLTQETFVRAWESLPRLREPGAFRGWRRGRGRGIAPGSCPMETREDQFLPEAEVIPVGPERGPELR
jgi:predicted RNA polymerase sigma factor